MKHSNVWLRRHNQRKLNQRLKWYDEMERTGDMPEAMIQELQDTARRNAGHEPEQMSYIQLRSHYGRHPSLSFLNHPRGG